MQTDAFVTTFRVPKMQETLTNNINKFKEILESEILAKEENEASENEGGANVDENNEGDGKAKEKNKSIAPGVTQQNSSTVHKTEAEKRREQRKIEREIRNKKMDKLKQKEVMQNTQDPNELAKIAEAKKSYGQYKLKMDEDYEVPEHEQVDFNKKRQQMILLEGSIHKLKNDFNIRISNLRVRKQENINEIKEKQERLRFINEELGTPEELTLPTINEKVEYPEKFFNVSD